VILSTGSVGYVTDKTFRAILDAMPRRPWIISFVLRMFPYDSLVDTFAEHGLVESIVTVCSGRNRPIGTRYVRVGADQRRVALEL
jgi:hypothetical protein